MLWQGIPLHHKGAKHGGSGVDSLFEAILVFILVPTILLFLKRRIRKGTLEVGLDLLIREDILLILAVCRWHGSYVPAVNLVGVSSNFSVVVV